jgi:tetratricopeptide (TPR) repeat protein
MLARNIAIVTLVSLCVLADYDLQKHRPFQAIDELEPYLEKLKTASAGVIPLEDAARLWTRAGDLYEAARNVTASLNARKRAEALYTLALDQFPTSKEIASALMISRVKLAESLKSYRLFEDARKVLENARKFATLSSTSTSSTVIAALWRAEANIERCDGRHIEAVDKWNKGAPKGEGEDWSIGVLKSATDIHLALDLWTILGSSIEYQINKEDIEVDEHGMFVQKKKKSRQDEIMLRNRRKKIAEALISIGPWERPTQFPRNYTRGLLALPWHSLESNGIKKEWKIVKDLIKVVRQSASALLKEWKSIPKSLKLVENECLADLKQGEWTYMTINAPWVRDIDKDGCSLHTPVACKVLREARSLGMSGSALRGTYSNLLGGTQLRSHCGMTNSQIKIHVGLEVPTLVTDLKGKVEEISLLAGMENSTSIKGSPCAFLTVSGESKAWQAGDVLIFDDSFEHSVKSTCKGERTVFQLVVPHPDIPINLRDGGRDEQRGD